MKEFVIIGSILFFAWLFTYTIRKPKYSFFICLVIVSFQKNLVIDHGFKKGLNDFYPETYSIGYQGYIILSDYNFYIYPIEYEVKSGVIPSEISVVGMALVESTNKYYNNIKVSIEPAFRFKETGEELEQKPISDKIIVLSALPIALKESYEILHLINDALQYGNFYNVKFHVKSHPSLELVATINLYLGKLDKDKIRYETIGQRIKKEYFEPVNEKSVRRFLRLNS